MDTKQTFSIIAFILALIIIFAVLRPEKYISGIIKSISIEGNSSWPTVDWGTSSSTGNTQNIPFSSVYAYQLSDTSTSGNDPFSQRVYNAKLARVFGDGRTETVIENLRNKFPNILNGTNQELVPYYFPQNSDILYFTFNNSYITSSMNRYHIYKYDVKNDNMKDLLSNRYLTNFVIPSPFDPRLMLAVDDDTVRAFQRLYFVNLEADNARMLVELTGNETLSSSVTGYGANVSADLFWINNHTVQYSVYKKPSNTSGTPQFLERRQLPI